VDTVAGCTAGNLHDCWNLLNPEGPMSPAGAAEQAILGVIGTGKSIYHDYTHGQRWYATGRLTGYAAIILLTRGAGDTAPEVAASGQLLPGATRTASEAPAQVGYENPAETEYKIGHGFDNIGGTAEDFLNASRPPANPVAESPVPAFRPQATQGVVGVNDPLGAIFMNGALAIRGIWIAIQYARGG
jgi:hypothetical protein